MRKFKFDEKTAIENMIKTNFVDVSNVTNTIYNLAKYNHHVLGLTDKANYNHILKYITDNCSEIYEESIYKDIEGCIRDAKKHHFAAIDEICITKSELKFIEALQDIKQEKAMFCVLAASKYMNKLNGQSYDAVFLTNAEICKMARISIPAKERDVFMQFAYDKECLQRHTWPGSTIKKLTFVSHDEEDEVVLRLHEEDYKDLAYTYLAYLTPHKFRRCFRCKKWIRNKSKGNQLCSECNKNNIDSDKDVFKTVECIDCGVKFIVSILNTKSCRCEECQEERDKVMKVERNSRYYNSHKIKTVAPEILTIQN